MKLRSLASRIWHTSPADNAEMVRRFLRSVVAETGQRRLSLAAEDRLREAFSVYRVESLENEDIAEFRGRVQSKIGVIDFEGEGYRESELERQSDTSLKFHWGHNHDFGNFRMEGRMGNRHIELLADFISLFPVEIEDFHDKDVLDIGCWTGGTALLLAAVGARVFAIEEVKKYAGMAEYLGESFGLGDRLKVEARSLYSCNHEAFFDRFDFAHFPGVIYHLSDPLIGLRIIFNALRVGGAVLVESSGIDRATSLCKFEGSLLTHSGDRARLDRGGWNWFKPSPTALTNLMLEAGFDEIETLWHGPRGRVFGFGRKTRENAICRAGLSVPDIK